MVQIESNVRGHESSLRTCDWSSQTMKPPCPSVKVSVVISGEEGPYALSAADLATIESEKTREKIKIKADHVANFHRKVLRRLAVERRGTDTTTTGEGKGRQISTGRYDYNTIGAVSGSGGLPLEEEQRILWQGGLRSDEVPCYQAVEVKGERGDITSLSDADTEARAALCAYRMP